MFGLRAPVKTSAGLVGEPKSTRHSAIVWILGFLVCYQLGSQYLMSSTLMQRSAEEEFCDLGDPRTFSSPQCAEAQLFHSWHAASVAEDLLQLEGFLADGAPEESETPALTSHSPAAESAENGASTTAAVIATAPSAPREAASVSPKQSTTVASPEPTTLPAAAPVEVNLLDQIQEAKCEMCLEPHRRDYPQCAQFQNLSTCKQLATPQATASNSTPGWAKRVVSSLGHSVGAARTAFQSWRTGDAAAAAAPKSASMTLLEQITEAKCEMCMEPARRGYPECANFANVTTCRTARTEESKQWNTMAAWSQDLRKVQAELSARANSSHSRPGAAASPKSKSKKALGEEVSRLGCDLCSTPSRRALAECVHFLATPECRLKNGEDDAAFNSHVQELAHQHEEWDKSFAGSIAVVQKELCADPARKNYPVCAGVLGNGSNTTQAQLSTALPSASNLRGSRGLKWPKNGWTGGSWRSHIFSQWHSSSRGAVTMSAAEMHRASGSQWQGKIPEVACISVVPTDEVALHLLGLLVGSFKKQRYEGPLELVLVYHFKAEEAARVVQSYVDGKLIKGVAARGDANLPSTEAFRFGAWWSDAEIIVQWDFDAWHHPQRVAMQVRSLALAGRPASILGRLPPASRNNQNQTTQDYNSAAARTGGERTLVGEAAWMRLHWYPLLRGNPALLESEEAAQMVLLEMPELYIAGASPETS